MTTFFNKKEEVIDLKLTRHGRYLLSMGKFKPHSYAFFDEDIIYDSQYGGQAPLKGALPGEIQNDISKRIKTSSRLKPQYTKTGVETEIREMNNHVRSGLVELGYGGFIHQQETYSLYEQQIYDLLSPKLQTSVAKTMTKTLPLGNSAIGLRHHPAWDISFYKAMLVSSEGHYTGSLGYTIPIPQLEATHTITTQFQNKGVGYYDSDFAPNQEDTIQSNLVEGQALDEEPNPEFGDLATSVRPDGTYITSKEEYIFLDVLEKNTDFSRENFEIEVFIVEDDLDGAQFLIPLSFYEPENLPLDAPENLLNQSFPEIDNSYVEYYFDINVDRGIEENILCDINLKDRKQDYSVDYQLEYSCEDQTSDKTYIKDPVVPDDPEIC